MLNRMLGFIFTILLFCSNIVLAQKVWYPPKAPDQLKNAPIKFINRAIVKIQTYWVEDNEYIHEELGAGLSLGIKRGKLFVMTAGHVIKHRAHGRASIIKVSLIATPRDPYEAEFIQADLNNDFGVIALGTFQIDRKDLDRVVKIAVDKNFVFSQGTSLKAIGHTLGKSWVLTNTKIREFSGNFVELERSQITNGNSGGPILNQYNQMVGMATSITGNKAYALPINHVLQILENWQIPYRGRLSADFVTNYLKIINAVRNNKEKPLMEGEKKGDLHKFKKTKYALFDKTKAAWIYDFNKEDYQNFYVELVGDYYGNKNQLDEAWRILVREIAKYLPEYINKAKQEGYNVVFWNFKVFKGTIHIRVEEFSGRLYVIILKNNPAFKKSKDVLTGLMYKYYSYMDEFLSDTYK